MDKNYSADRRTGAVPPFVLFPASAPAGWSWNGDPLPTGLVADPFASPTELVEKAKNELRAVAISLFSDSLAIGLTPSEAADVVVRDGTYLRARATVIELEARVPEHAEDRPMSARHLFPPGLLALGEALKHALDRGLRSDRALSIGLARLARHRGGITPINTSLSEEERRTDPMWFMSDPILPNSVVEAMLASHRAYAMSAVVDGLVREDRWKARLIFEAAKIWAAESRSYLRLVASLPGTEVSEEDIPAAERLNIEREVADQATLTAELEAISAA